MTARQRLRLRLLAALSAFLVGSGPFLSPALAQDANSYRGEAANAASAGRYVDALAAYTRAIALAPDDPIGYVARAQLLVGLGHNDLAALDYDVAVTLKPDDGGLQGDLCLTLAMSNHDLDRALAACNMAVRLDPANHDALGRRGYVQLRRSAYVEAEADFTAALALNPAGPNEMFGLGLAMIHVGRAQQGRDIIASATLESAGLVNEWEARGFGVRGEIRPGKPQTTAEQPIATLADYRLFVNRGAEAYVGLAIATRCGRMLPPAKAADLGDVMLDNSSISWSGECRFGLIHGEGRLSNAEGSLVRYAYGRAIPSGEAGAALEEKLKLAFEAAELALSP